MNRNCRIKAPRRLLQSDHGAAAVEFALVMPLLLILFVSFAEFGRLMHDYLAVSKSLRDGARYAARLPVTCAGFEDATALTDITNLVLTDTIDGTGRPVIDGWTNTADVNVTITCIDNTARTFLGVYDERDSIPVVEVSAAMPFTFLYPGMIWNDTSITISQRHQEVSIGE